MRLESQGYEVVTAGDGVEALEKVRELAARSRAARHHDAQDGRHRDGQADKGRSFAAVHPGDPGYRQGGRQGRHRRAGKRRRRLPDQAGRPCSALGAGAGDAADQGVARYRAGAGDPAGGAGGRARRVEPDLGGTGRGAGRRNRADRQAEAVSGAADRGNHRLVWRRDDPRSSPARYCRAVLRHARLYRLCRNRRAGGRDGGARRISRRAGTADPSLRGHPRPLCRRRSDRLFQRPGAMSRSGAARRAPCGRDARSGHGRSPALGRPAGTKSALASASPKATPPSAGSGSRTVSTTAPSAL